MSDNSDKAFSVNITIPTIVGMVIGAIFLTFIITFLITKKSNPKDDGLVTLNPSLNINDCATANISGSISLDECKNYIGERVSNINPGALGDGLTFNHYGSPSFKVSDCIQSSPERKMSMQDIIAGVTYIVGDPLGETKNSQCWMYSDSNNKINYNIMSPNKPIPGKTIQDKIINLLGDKNNSTPGVHIDPASITIYDPSLVHVNRVV